MTNVIFPDDCSGYDTLHMRAPLPFHIELLQDEIARRKKKNSRYSLRAFSTSLGLAPSSLSRILSGENDPSLTTCRNIIRELNLSDEQKKKFIESVAETKFEALLKLLD